MKVLFIIFLCMVSVWADAQPCCSDSGLIGPRGTCPNSTRRINIGCDSGHFLLKDAVVTENALTTYDTSGYIFTTDPSQYCVGRMRNSTDPSDNTTISVAVVCFQKADVERQGDIEINGILTLISVVFLFLTVSVYTFLPQLRDLQGKCIMCMCSSMALGFLSLGIMQLGYGFSNNICSFNGFSIYFWLMATFFWMNVVSINLYRSVTQSQQLKKTASKQFFVYSVYAWGSTFAFLAIVLITNYIEGDHLSPGFGVNSCWFQGPKETWAFFYGPLAALITVNIILFVITSFRLWKTSQNYEMSGLKNLKYKFLLYLRLFIVMGISWIFEIASFAHAQSHIIWKIADIFNCLQGLVFFLLLVIFRRRALHGLADRGVGGKLSKRLAERLNNNDEENDSIIDSEPDNGTPYSNVNLNN